MWHTALGSMVRVLRPCVRHGSLMAIVIGLRRAATWSLRQDNVVRLAKLLSAFVLVVLYFFGCDLLTEAFPAGQAEVVAC